MERKFLPNIETKRQETQVSIISSKMTANTVELAQNRPLQFFLSPKEVYFALLQSKVHRPG